MVPIRLFYDLLFLFLSLHVLTTSQTSFNFTNFSGKWKYEEYCPEDGEWICLHKAATVDKNGDIILTPNSSTKTTSSKGRATYSQPVQLWNSATHEIANFTTEFTFAIQDLNSSDRSADGLVFFMSPFPFVELEESSGGNFGLVGDKRDSHESREFIAVELDTYYNRYWDPSDFHVGIDVNSVESAVYRNLSATLQDSTGKLMVDYNSISSNLSVTLVLFNASSNSFDDPIHLSHVVDLKLKLSEQVAVGFIATTYNQVELHKILSWSFLSTSDKQPDGGKSKTIKLIIGLVVGLGVLFVSLLGLLIWFVDFKRGRMNGLSITTTKADDDDLDGEFEEGIGPRRFTYRQLVSATNNFHKDGKLGEGGFGPVYKGFLRDLDLNVAVKRISGHSRQGRKEYISEVKIFSQLRHKNLVPLIGWCHKKTELLLVYELMDNGGLDSHISTLQRSLSWSLRYRIAQGLASALVYLHEGWKQCVVHRDVKSSNVMLDKEFNAKLGDFGLARLSEHGSGLQTTLMAGTVGYMAPECIIAGKVGKEADVYSFGIVALEIACGRKCMDRVNVEGNEVRLVEWVWEMYGQGTLLEAVDNRILNDEDFDEQQAMRLMVLGLWCAHPDLHQRPSVSQSIAVLNLNAPLPNLPQKMPVPSFTSIPIKSPYKAEYETYKISELGSSSTSSMFTPR